MHEHVHVLTFTCKRVHSLTVAALPSYLCDAWYTIAFGGMDKSFTTGTSAPEGDENESSGSGPLPRFDGDTTPAQSDR